ncbi:MAG: hypothetical protein FWB78_06600 [Treponema sp.]|nr:hypothetical protein [Treponema sp.]
MRKLGLVTVFVVLTGLVLSCASNPPANTFGEVEAVFESSDVVRGNLPNLGIATIFILPVALVMDIANMPTNSRLTSAAHEALMEVAKARYGENIDVTRVQRILVGRNHATGLYQYAARGYVIPVDAR